LTVPPPRAKSSRASATPLAPPAALPEVVDVSEIRPIDRPARWPWLVAAGVVAAASVAAIIVLGHDRPAPAAQPPVASSVAHEAAPAKPAAVAPAGPPPPAPPQSAAPPAAPSPPSATPP